MTVRARLFATEYHSSVKLTLEKVCVGSVSRQLQDLENDVNVRLTKACCAGIVGPGLSGRASVVRSPNPSEADRGRGLRRAGDRRNDGGIDGRLLLPQTRTGHSSSPTA